MNVLVLHNNNLPIYLYRANVFNLADDISVDSKLLKYDGIVQSESFDEYVSKQLASISDVQYDIIVLPFSFSIENYLEFTGLRVATHIRLTPQWKKINTPILFIGPDTNDDICTLSSLAGVLYSNRVFTSNSVDQSELISVFRSIFNEYQVTSETEAVATESSYYDKFLDAITIQPPSNLDTRHSVANEWAIYRWEQLFKTQDALDYDALTHNLYIKQLIARNRRIEFFNKRFYKKHPSLSHAISGIQGKHILYIDDQEDKGWGKLIGNIISSSKATLSTCSFGEYWHLLTKEQLLLRLKDFIREDAKQYGIADCYIVDLRLHEADSDPELDHTQLCGHLIADFIKEEVNKGCQIIIFTASNKSWNVKNALIHTHVADYIVKESPEMGYSSNDTYLSLGRFMESIKKAVEHSYIKDIYSNLDSYNNEDGELDLLHEFAELLTIDNGEANPTIIKACALNLIVFLEQFLKSNLEVDLTYNIYCSNVKIGNFRGKLFVKIQENNGRKNVIESVWYDKPTPITSEWKEAVASADITKIIAPLYMYYGLSNDSVNLVVNLKHKRNTNIAHGGKACDLTIMDLRNIYDKVICYILQKSFTPKQNKP